MTIANLAVCRVAPKRENAVRPGSENDQLVLVLSEIEVRLSKSGAVCVGLEVKMDRGAPVRL
jgi:hypothetical protein